MRSLRWPALVALSAALLACDQDRADALLLTSNGPISPPKASSQPTIEQQLSAFRRTVRVPAPDSMDGERSARALVRRFALALERADTNAFRQMALTRAEFAYLYYPESPYTAKPYRQDPALLWFMIQEGSNKGLTRLFDRYAGSPTGYVGYRCSAASEVHGSTRLWPRCFIRRVVTRGDTIEDRLFGTIIERNGRFKFLSYVNKL
jgi:hypothetical protein